MTVRLCPDLQDEPLCWYGKPYPGTMLNKGSCCFFCAKAWEGFYASTPQYNTLSKFVKELGSDKSLHVKFFRLRHETVLAFQSVKMTKDFTKNGHNIDWQQLQQVVESYELAETVIKRARSDH